MNKFSNLFNSDGVKSVSGCYLCIMITNRVFQYIEKEELIRKSNKVLVALSGGADSIALLHILLSLGYDCEAAHCNFHLRGEESDRDESFVSNLCEEWNIPLHIIHFRTNRYAAERKISIEMAARELRYKWFGEISSEIGAQVIATGHHRDDSVETLLINLIRGAGINGLLGIRPKNGNIVRPLLCVNRDDILEYLRSINQDYVTDSTNLRDEYTRNKVRLNILPAMEKINPAVRKNIINTSNHLSEVAYFYNEAIKERLSGIKSENGISIPALLKEPAGRTLLFEILYPMGFNSSQIDNIYRSLNGQSGKYFISNTGSRVIRDRNELIIEETISTNDKPPFLLSYDQVHYSSEFVIPKEKHIACFDADKLEQLSIRKWEKGDFFIPFGMKGRKLISDYLTEKKFPLNKKENQWVLCSGKHIAWVIGERTDNRFRVDEKTRNVLIIKMHSISML